MADIATHWNTDLNSGDWLKAGPSLANGNDLETALLISLFTDRQAMQEALLLNETNDPRGWWADEKANLIGSHLWLLQRAKQTPDTLKRAYNYIVEALQWLIDDGVVARFDIFVEWSNKSQLGAHIIAHQSNGTSLSKRYAWAWEGVN